MKYWYFRFEGKFTKKSPNYGDGVFSNCLVPEQNFQRAKAMFSHTLKAKNIKLDEIIEYFSIDGDELDPTDESNTFWIEWYRKTAKLKKTNFDTWQVYDLAREN